MAPLAQCLATGCGPAYPQTTAWSSLSQMLLYPQLTIVTSPLGLILPRAGRPVPCKVLVSEVAEDAVQGLDYRALNAVTAKDGDLIPCLGDGLDVLTGTCVVDNWRKYS